MTVYNNETIVPTHMTISGTNVHWNGRGPIDSPHVVTNVTLGITTDATHIKLLSNDNRFNK